MCWNWQVSLITWIIALVTSIFLIRRARPFDRSFALLLLSYSNIQLFECLMWLDQKCGTLNRYATYGAYFALYSHALAFGLGLYWEQGIWFPLLVGLCLVCIGLIRARNENWACSRPTTACQHLTWGFRPHYYVFVFWICIAMIIWYVRPTKLILLSCSLFFLSFLLPAFSACVEGVSSLWCFNAALAGPLFVWFNS